MPSRFRFSWMLALTLLLSAVPMFAQSQATTGVIEGSVEDESGGVLPGVTVSVKNTSTNFEQIQVTDANGRFRGSALPLGPYRVSASLSGFSTAVRQGFNLTVGQTVSLRFTLKASALAEEIVVTGEAPVVEVSRAEGSTLIDQKAVEGLPNNGRNFLELSKLTPGVAIVQGPDGDEISINGQKGIQNNVSVDGADFNNPFFGEQRGGQRPAFTFNLDAVKEIVVITDGANAEFGRSSSGFINVVTKSGGNELHATAHGYLKNDSFSSNGTKADGSEAPKFNFDQQQFGFTFGGPIRKDEVFYFFSVDHQSADSTKQTDPTRIEQRVVDYFASIGIPGENGPITRTNDANVLLAKVDWQLANSSLLTLRYNYTWSEQENGTFDVDSWGVSANAVEKDKSNAVTGSLISPVGASRINELRFQYAREDRPRDYNGPNITGQNRPLPDTAFDFGKGYRFGMPFFIPVEYYDTRFQFNDNFSWLRGNHAFKAGVEYNRVESVQTFIGFANGRYIFSSTDGFLNYTKNRLYVECSNGSSSQTGVCPAGTTVTGPVLLYLQQAGVGGLTVEQAGTQSIPQEEPAVFFQDDWQVSANLNIQYGLRWEAQIQPDLITEKDDLFYADFIGTSSKGQEFPGDGTIPSDTSMWQPRLGFSWAPKGDASSVVRGNAGYFYARIPGLNLASSRSTDGSRGQTIFRNSELTGILGAVPAYPNLIPQSEIGIPFFPGVFVFDKDFQNPRTLSSSLSYEFEVAPEIALLFKYNYARTDHITRFVDRNDALLGSPWSSGLAPGGVNGIGVLTTVESTAKSRYDGLTIGLNKRYSNRFGFQANYTYSKDKSDDDNERDPFSFRYAKITDLDAEYSWSDRDQRHRFNGWFLWNAPGDLSVNIRYSYRSAQPKSITASGADAGTPQDRINADGSVTKRNLGRKDNQFSSVDFRISRLFQFNSFAIEPAIDVFNVTNSKNLKTPEVTNLIFNFDGTVTSGLGDPRQAQLGIRVIY